MREQTISWVKIDRIETPMTARNLYEFRPARGWRWLQRAAFAVLDWIGAHHEEVVTTYRRTPQENSKLLKGLLDQEGQWIEYVHHEETPHIYIGPDDYDGLLALSEFRDMQSTTFSGRIETRDQYGSKWHDIPITVVPWMKGCLIAPQVRS